MIVRLQTKEFQFELEFNDNTEAQEFMTNFIQNNPDASSLYMSDEKDEKGELFY